MPTTRAGNGKDEPQAPRRTAVDEVVLAIQTGIRTGRYVPGQRLVESDLTKELGVSRGPLREALSRLAAAGVLDIEPFRGAVVRRMTRDDVLELFQMRAVLEGEAARLAALRIDDGDNRKRLEAAAKSMRGFLQKDDLRAYMDVNTELHDLIVDVSGNRLLQSFVQQLHTHSYRLQFRNLLNAGVKANSIGDHEDILGAILAGQPKKAETAMRKHINRSLELSLAADADSFA